MAIHLSPQSVDYMVRIRGGTGLSVVVVGMGGGGGEGLLRSVNSGETRGRDSKVIPIPQTTKCISNKVKLPHFLLCRAQKT